MRQCWRLCGICTWPPAPLFLVRRSCEVCVCVQSALSLLLSLIFGQSAKQQEQLSATAGVLASRSAACPHCQSMPWHTCASAQQQLSVSAATGALDQRVRVLERDNAQMAADVAHVQEAAKSSERLASVLRRDVARAQQVRRFDVVLCLRRQLDWLPCAEQASLQDCLLCTGQMSES